MQIDRKDIGYTLYSRLEEALRSWVGETLLNLGSEWASYVPPGILQRIEENSQNIPFELPEDPSEVLEETFIPDLSEIVCYKNSFDIFVKHNSLTKSEFQTLISTLYEVRNKIAHVRRNFSVMDLDKLFDVALQMVPLLDVHGNEINTTIECLRTTPSKILVRLPLDFIKFDEIEPSIRNNLPILDYDADGGFVGRKNELKKLQSLVQSNLNRVVTISGAGGVGKTTLAHRFCVSLLNQSPPQFDGMIWVSAKEEKLTLTGIEPIEPTIRNYEELLDQILLVFGWLDLLKEGLEKKEEYVSLILSETDRGVLILIDNLETIQDERILDFIKDIPMPNKALITSRMGMGEVERRYPLKEMSKTDALALTRAVAREKGADSLIKLPDDVLYKYVQSMSSYPLAIKWVVGQVAIGKDIDKLVDSLQSTSGDVARFCFQHIYENLLSGDARLVLCSLASMDRPLTRGVLTHLSGLQSEELDNALLKLTLASLVIQEQEEGENKAIVTKFTLLPLTLGYLRAKLQDERDLQKLIQGRMEVISSQIEETDNVGRQYRYALQYMGATTDEERIAAGWAMTGYQRSQLGDYSGAIAAFQRATEIAPNFSRIYRNWATVEADEKYFDRADELMSKATSIEPNDPTLWFTWGNIAKRRLRLDQAKKYFQTALGLSPNDGAVLGGLGEVEKRSGNYKEADDYFKQALKAPHGVKGYKHEVVTYTAIADNLGRWAKTLYNDKQFDAALEKAKSAYEFASRAVNMSSVDERAVFTLKEVSFILGKLINAQDGIDAALPYLKSSLIEEPTRFGEKKLVSQVCLFAASELYKAKRFDEAIYLLDIGSKQSPDHRKHPEVIARYDFLRRKLMSDVNSERKTGVIVDIKPGNNYGFIESDDKSSQQIFVHRNDFVAHLSYDDFQKLTGAKVDFLIEIQPDGRKKALSVGTVSSDS